MVEMVWICDKRKWKRELVSVIRDEGKLVMRHGAGNKGEQKTGETEDGRNWRRNG
jgi:hypothetical protein